MMHLHIFYNIEKYRIISVKKKLFVFLLYPRYIRFKKYAFYTCTQLHVPNSVNSNNSFFSFFFFIIFFPLTFFSYIVNKIPYKLF